MSCETRPICLAILSTFTTIRGKKIPLDADGHGDGHRRLQVAVADRSPITKGQGSRPPPGRYRGGRGREIAYQAWEEGRSVDPGVLLAASLTESGCTER